MRDHEIAHVLCGSGDAASGIGFDKFERLRFVGSLLITVGHQRLEIFRKRLNERGLLHVERGKDVVLHILIERFARNTLNNVAGKRGRVVRIRGGYSRRKDTIRNVLFQKSFQAVHVLRVGDEEIAAQFFKPGRVGHDIF